MHFDYVDIGTSDFETSLDTRSSVSESVLLVEPLFDYLRNIPDEENVYKANFAISNVSGWGELHHIPRRVIEEYSLAPWLRGCNSLNKPHITAQKYLAEFGLDPGLMKVQKVRIIPFYSLLVAYEIDSIGRLKVDTEGHDHVILHSVSDCIEQMGLKIQQIQFEYLEVFENTKTLDAEIKFLQHLGYSEPIYHGDNVTMELA
jgi:hypothetical protein